MRLQQVLSQPSLLNISSFKIVQSNWCSFAAVLSAQPAAQRGQAEVEGGDLPEDMQIGFSGKGSGIYGSFGTPAPSTRPTPQVSQHSSDPATPPHPTLSARFHFNDV